MFKKIECKKCQTIYDEFSDSCPTCGKKNDFFPLKKKKNSMTFLDPIKQAFFFLIGWGGLKVVSIILSFIIKQIAVGMYEYNSPLYNEFLSSNKVSMILNFLSYATLFLSMIALLWDDIFVILNKFKKIRPLIYGIGYGLILVAVNAVYFMFLKLCGVQTTDNGNEIGRASCRERV